MKLYATGFKLLLFAGLLAFCSFSFFKPITDCKPQTDGIYVFKINEEHSAVVRFYADGTVLASSSTNDYKEVMTWFNRDPENFSRVLSGKYSNKKCAVKFEVKGETGYQYYKGSINGNTIVFTITNPDHSSTERTYTFVKP
jgi:hypothetical protein